MSDEDFIDSSAERHLLSAALHGNTDFFQQVAPEAFTHWRHQEVASAIRQCIVKGIPADMATVVRLAIETNRASPERARQVGATVTELATLPVYGDGAYYAERVNDLFHHRSLQHAVEKFKRETIYAFRNDDETVLSQAMKELRLAADSYQAARLDTTQPLQLESLHDLLNEPDDEYDWLVPGLLERGDRLILTGFEGTGKSYLLAQLSMCIAAGVHPFTQEPLLENTHRVLILDAENARRQVKRRYRGIMRQVNDIRERNDMGQIAWSQTVFPWVKPNGFDLTDPGTLAEINRMMEAAQPALVVAGPLYKMSRLNVQEEQAAQELTLCLDDLRTKYGFTLITEAHAGHATDGVTRKVRPIGSSLFLRWPEFGLGIVPHPDLTDDTSDHPRWVQVRHWRGSREERDWPDALKHGDFLPWEPLDDTYYAKVRSRVW